MKIERPKKKLLLLSSGIIIAIGAGIGVWYYLHHLQAQSASDNSQSKTATKEQIDAGNQAKIASVENSQNTGTPKPSPTADGVPPSQNGAVGVSIPYADASRLTVLIDGVVSGNCILKLSSGGTTHTQTTTIQAGPSSSTCQGFSYSGLTPGEWTATVTATTSNSTGTATKNITVE